MTSSARAMAFSPLPAQSLAATRKQKGITLVECLVSLALSAVVLAGMNDLLTITFAVQADADRRYRLHAEAQKIMRRISMAIYLAEYKKKDVLVKVPGSTNDWLNRYDPVKKHSVIYKYDWSATNQALTETVGAAMPVTLLNNVTDFQVDSLVTNTDTALISVTLTVGNAPDQVTITETRRLGGNW